MARITSFQVGSPPWPTADPFLFCVHHLDHYPPGTTRLGPPPDQLAGRSIGSDFANVDGWNMYHGDVVPGFPAHPHRGFETITVVRRGLCDHADSLGAAARYGAGDVQWLTAGSGIQHSEMFPLLDGAGPNTLQLFQIWLNLPAASKMVDPYFTMLWAPDIPVLQPAPGVEIEVIAGPLDGESPPSPPPDSWASRPEADVVVWHLTIAPGGTWELPLDSPRTVYCYEGSGSFGGTAIDRDNAATAVGERPETVTLQAGPDGLMALVLGGRPIAEPVASYGPFVMNTEQEIRQAFMDYRSTEFGGWPWAEPGPTHGADGDRFAVRPDGVRETPPK